jgi:NitT/TauT family transport system substrate-binding protein
VFLARARGYFREQGIDVDYVPAQGGSDTIAPLASGDLELAGGAVSPGMFNAIDRGIGMRMVADKGISRPGFEFTQLVVRKDLLDSGEVRDLGDLRDRRIGMASVRSGVESLVARILASGGVGFGEVDASVMSASDALVALGNRAIDANITIEPVLTAGLDRGVAASWAPGRSSAAYGGVYQAAVLLYSERLAVQTELARRFMVAYLQGVRAYNDAFAKGEGRADVVRVLIEATSVKEPALYERMQMAGLDPDGRIARESVQLDLDHFRQTGLYSGPLTLDAVLDTSYVEYALQQLGPYQ